MDNEKLKEILERHRKWLNDEDGGERANLYEANLYGANLSEANQSETTKKQSNQNDTKKGE